MREILFRGQSIDRRKWYEGDLYQTRLKSVFFIQYYTEHGDRMAIEVDPETVGQYTGLTDKNGKKIFEGDIVVTNKFGSPNRKYVIVYDDEIATYIGEGKKGCCHYFTTFSRDADAFEVIGNIHDNPELLKGGDEG